MSDEPKKGKGFKRALIIMGLVILAGLITWGVVTFIRKRKDAAALDENKSGGKDLGGGGADPSTHTIGYSLPKTAPPAASVYPLKKGSKGAEVTSLQKALNALYNSGLAEDGDFGDLTYKAYITNVGASADKYPITAEQFLQILTLAKQKIQGN